MLIIIDRKMCAEAKKNLSKYGSILELETSGIVYPSISGHPDIFFCKVGNKLFTAANTPFYLIDKLRKSNVDVIETSDKLGFMYPHTASFNAVIEYGLFIHNHKITAKSLLQQAKDLKMLTVKQGYTRCNTLFIDQTHCITSDKSIETALLAEGIKVLYVSPKNITLDGFEHGFFGGCCGVFNHKLFVNGSLSYFSEGDNIKHFVSSIIEIIELSQEPLTDVGSILFVE